MSNVLTDEEMQEMRNRAKLNDNRQIDPMAFARSIERAVLEKMGEQEPAVTIRDSYVTNINPIYEDDSGYINGHFYAHPLPQQAIPEGWREMVTVLANDLESEILAKYTVGMLEYPSQKRSFDADMDPIIRARAMLSASPKV